MKCNSAQTRPKQLHLAHGNGARAAAPSRRQRTCASRTDIESKTTRQTAALTTFRTPPAHHARSGHRCAAGSHGRGRRCARPSSSHPQARAVPEHSIRTRRASRSECGFPARHWSACAGLRRDGAKTVASLEPAVSIFCFFSTFCFPGLMYGNTACAMVDILLCMLLLLLGNRAVDYGRHLSKEEADQMSQPKEGAVAAIQDWVQPFLGAADAVSFSPASNTLKVRLLPCSHVRFASVI